MLIVDDEPLARASVRMVLKALDEVSGVEEAGSGAEAVAAIREREFGAVFLDVRMPEIDGFEVLRLLEGETVPPVVFVTAFDDQAVAAFDTAAVDYVVKPFSDDRLVRAARRALDRAQDRHGAPGDAGSAPDSPSLDRTVTRILVRGRRRTHFVLVDDVDVIEAAGNYVTLVVGSREHLVRATLARLETDLRGAGFRRIHRSALVNFNRVGSIEHDPSGDGTVVMRSGRRLRLSRRYKDRISELLG